MIELRYEAIPGYGPTASALIHKLKHGKPGDEFTEAELKTICGIPVDVLSKGYDSLHSAIQYCVRYRICVWQRVRGAKKIRCLNANEVNESCNSDIKVVNRRTGRALNKIHSVDMTELDDQSKTHLLITSAQLGMVQQMTTKSVAKKIEDLHSNVKVDIDKMLESFVDK